MPVFWSSEKWKIQVQGHNYGIIIFCWQHWPNEIITFPFSGIGFDHFHFLQRGLVSIRMFVSATADKISDFWSANVFYSDFKKTPLQCIVHRTTLQHHHLIISKESKWSENDWKHFLRKLLSLWTHGWVAERRASTFNSLLRQKQEGQKSGKPSV